MRTLATYNDALATAPRMRRRAIDCDSRIIAFTVEPDGVFLYADSAHWCDAGLGTFRGATAREAVARFKREVRRAGHT